MQNRETIQSIDIGVPSQTYGVEFTMTAKGFMPFIRETVLRLLNLGSLKPSKIGSFLGLTTREIEIALNQLKDLGEVRMNKDGELELTNEALRHFDNLEGDRPLVKDLQERNERVSFNLIDYSYVAKSQKIGSPVRSIKLKPDPSTSSQSILNARHAFTKRYKDIFDLENTLPPSVNVNDIEIYKISDIRKRRDFYYTIPLHFQLNLEDMTIERVNTDGDVYSDVFETTITDILAKTVNVSNINEISVAADKLNDDLSVSCLIGDKFNAQAFVTKVAQLKNHNTENVVGEFGAREYFLGAITLDGNWLKIKNLIQSYYEITSKEEAVPIDWIVPSDLYWLKSSQYYQNITSLIDKYGKNSLVLKLPIKGIDDRQGIKNWERHLGKKVSECSEYISEGCLNGHVEVITLENIFVAVTYHLQVLGTPMTIPFGFVSTRMEDITNIRDVIGGILDGYGSEYRSNNYS